jgi:hypothetical protein
MSVSIRKIPGIMVEVTAKPKARFEVAHSAYEEPGTRSGYLGRHVGCAFEKSAR